MEQTTAERIYAIIDAAEDDGQFGIPEDRLAAAETIAAEIDALAAKAKAYDAIRAAWERAIAGPPTYPKPEEVERFISEVIAIMEPDLFDGMGGRM